MFQHDKTIISEEVLDKHFVCNLDSCKGICCVEGEAGAPLTKTEGKLLKEIWDDLKPYLTTKGIKSIEKQGFYTVNFDGELETPLITNAGACAYATFEKNGMVKCAIEQAYKDNAIDFYKPISCHLYPIRVKEYKTMTAINYHSWPICNDACTLGEKLKVPIYQFVKDALIRKFGKQWYDELDRVAKEYYDSKQHF